MAQCRCSHILLLRREGPDWSLAILKTTRHYLVPVFLQANRCTGAPVYRCTYMDKIIGQNHSENVPVPVLHFHKQYDHKYRCVLHMKCRAQLAVVKLLGTKDLLI